MNKACDDSASLGYTFSKFKKGKTGDWWMRGANNVLGSRMFIEFIQIYYYVY